VSAAQLRVLTIALFAGAAVLTAIAGDGVGPVLAGGVACFSAGVLVYFRWRRAQRAMFSPERIKPGEENAE
jgi:hypothetical protein